MAKKTFSDECIFCVKYLKEHGIVSRNFAQLGKLVQELDVDFNLVRVEKHPKAEKTKAEKREEFFRNVAYALRNMWPPGNKDGKWPWRCDVFTLAKRLETLWKERKLSEDITQAEVVSVAKEYLTKFKEDNTYMKTLKYFVLKHVAESTSSDSSVIFCSSPLADALEARNDVRKLEAELDEILANSSAGEGELR